MLMKRDEKLQSVTTNLVLTLIKHNNRTQFTHIIYYLLK